MARARTRFSNVRLFALIAIAMTAGSAFAGETGSAPIARQSLDDAWWTGPILASGAGTLPQGHALIEPYLFDVIRDARYDQHGHRRSADRSQTIGSLTYVLYGVTDRFTAGLIPTFVFNDASNGRDSSG